MKRRTKRLLWAAVAVFVLLLAATVAGAFYLVDYALTADHLNEREAYKSLYEHHPELRPWVDSLKQAEALRDTFVVIDGNKLHATLVAAKQPTNKVAVLIHGYKNSNVMMLDYGHIYYEQLGYNLLLPDLYGHGQSEGDHINMGWLDRKDVIQWLRVADAAFKGDSAATQMVLHGVSMGAATVMAMSGEQLPPSVKCIVEDCGYTCVFDQFKHNLKDEFGLPSFPLLNAASLVCRMKYDWGFGEASMLEQVRKCRLPMLFIHGDNDDFVPTAMVNDLYAAKPQPKELYMGKGSAHALTLSDHRAEYAARITAFCNRYIH